MTARDPRLHLRRAREGDAPEVLRWRNDPHTRAMSRDMSVVVEEQHVSWFRHAVGDPDHVILIGEFGPRKVGMVRFDRGDCGWEISINMAPESRGQGHGRPMLHMALALFTAEHRNASVLAVIKPENARSIRLFEASGFVETGADEEHLHYALAATGAA